MRIAIVDAVVLCPERAAVVVAAAAVLAVVAPLRVVPRRGNVNVNTAAVLVQLARPASVPILVAELAIVRRAVAS